MPSTLKTSLVVLLLLAGCGEDRIEPVRLFKLGDIVEFKVSGQRGQIIFLNYCEGWKQKKYGQACTYEVRVFSPQTHTNTRLFNSDGPITTTHIATLDFVREYELRKAD